MGLLADVFSYGDGLKRKMRGLLDDPAGTVDLGARRFNEDQGGLLNLFANAYPMGGDKTVLNTPEQRKQMQAEAASKALETYGGLLGATVWHGSPHKFNKFDSSKIGTGEGAQAYGHGLYLAESDTVARHYKNAGADPSTFVPVRSIRDPAQMAATALDRAGGDMRHATAVLTQNAQSGDITAGAALQLLKQRAALPESKYAGHMYKVDLPDDAIAKMLNWDAGPSGQPKEVIDALRAIGIDDWKNGGDLYWKLKRTKFGVKESMPANKASREAQAYASELLRANGIPGIRYLDGGSRGAGGGTSNYVMFPGNEGLLKILERNGSPIP